MNVELNSEVAAVWRHQRVWLDPACFDATREATHLPPQYRQQLADWVNAGRPLIGRAWTAAEGLRGGPVGVPVGLALQPFAEKVRIGLVVEPAHVLRCETALPLREALEFLPAPICKSAVRVLETMDDLDLEVSVYGSAFWSHAAQVSCMSPSSDLDLLLSPSSATQARQSVACLRRLPGEGDVRLDGEILLPDGSGAAWAELDGRERVMVKTQWGPELRSAASIWSLWP